jgi:hypothetical protein
VNATSSRFRSCRTLRYLELRQISWVSLVLERNIDLAEIESLHIARPGYYPYTKPNTAPWPRHGRTLVYQVSSESTLLICTVQNSSRSFHRPLPLFASHFGSSRSFINKLVIIDLGTYRCDFPKACMRNECGFLQVPEIKNLVRQECYTCRWRKHFSLSCILSN